MTTQTKTERMAGARKTRAAYGKLNAYVQACKKQHHHFHERWSKKLAGVEEQLKSATLPSKLAKLLTQRRDLEEKLTRPPVLGRGKLDAARKAFLEALPQLRTSGLADADLVGAGVPAADLRGV